MISSFSIKEAANLAGFRSVYTVDYLCRSKLVIPSVRSSPGRGNKRRYSFRDIVLLRALNRLLSQRLPVSKLKAAQEEFARVHGSADDFAVMTKYLTTDGTNVFYRENDGQCIELTRSGQLAFAFMLDIGQVAAEIRDEARALIQMREAKLRLKKRAKG